MRNLEWNSDLHDFGHFLNLFQQTNMKEIEMMVPFSL